MLRTLRRAGAAAAASARDASRVSVMLCAANLLRSSCPGLSRASTYFVPSGQTWMAGTSARRRASRFCPAMTSKIASPAQQFRLARQLDRLDLLELDRALGHEVVEVAVGRARDLGAIEVDFQRAAMVLVGPGRGVADALHAGRPPVLLLVEALGDVVAGGAAVLGGPVERLL